MEPRLTLADGARLAHDTTGAAAGSEGPLAVYAHGMSLSRRVETEMDLFGWDAVAALPGLRLVRYDARGHGGSTGGADPAGYTFGHFADGLLALLDRLSPGRPVTGMGSSLGSGTVLTAAVREPARFDRLVLLIPPTAWETRVAQADLYRRLADAAGTGGPELLAKALAAAPVPASLTEAPGYPARSLGVHREALPSVPGATASRTSWPAERDGRRPDRGRVSAIRATYRTMRGTGRSAGRHHSQNRDDQLWAGSPSDGASSASATEP
ncbi:alpha/beta fold hydrolase [Streptomyces sp. NPDC042319]|uniref:alpha/beta fold hydrolase n=1 Tax=Streptomyces sp. NPDC042319 TaxID=3154332 RepID=UPI0033DC6958